METGRKERSRLLEALDPALRTFVERGYAAPIGVLLPSERGWEYLRPLMRRGEEEFLSGSVEFRGFTGVLAPPRSAWRAAPGTMRAIAASRPAFGLRIDSWIVDGVCFEPEPAGWKPLPGGERVREMRLEDLSGDRWEALVFDSERSYYWAEGFDPDFYVAQARAGCIAIAADRGDRAFLMPELQAAYAVLDWENLRAGKSAARLMRKERLESLGVELRVSTDVESVLAALDEAWKGDSWLLPPYRDLMSSLAMGRRDGFVLLGTELSVKGCVGREIVAGELGYAIGRTYTSLTGFFRRERKEWDGLGIAQLHLLARSLERAGFAFWNLGHPYMKYKLDLGARVIPRRDFLERWKDAISGEALLPLTTARG